jgi:hypothetical protein
MAFPHGLLPETYEEFEQRLLSSDLDPFSAESFLDTVVGNIESSSRCAVCDRAIVTPWAVADAIALHYGLSPFQKEVLVSDLLQDVDFDFGDGVTCGRHNS